MTRVPTLFVGWAEFSRRKWSPYSTAKQPIELKILPEIEADRPDSNYKIVKGETSPEKTLVFNSINSQKTG